MSNTNPQQSLPSLASQPFEARLQRAPCITCAWAVPSS